MSYAKNCKFFSGYKPCTKSQSCNENCASFEKVNLSILIIHLGALGAVVRSTSLLKAIKRKYPNSKITWITEKPAHQLLRDHPFIDRVLTTDTKDLLILKALEFEVAFAIDKSILVTGILNSTKVDQVYGFVSDPKTGAIEPATKAASELWELGLNNEKKFFQNIKTETQLVHEALELGPFLRDSYFLPLSQTEKIQLEERKKKWSLNGQKLILGINTGCSDVIQYKKLSVQFQRKIIQKLDELNIQIVLLGGPEDTQRNIEIAENLNVIKSETQAGLRDGLVSVAACDLILTGDSLGMHMAISQKVYTVAWFGPTCSQEIDLFDRGQKIFAKATCSPCWKRLCSEKQMCYDLVDINEIIQAIEKGIQSVNPVSDSNSLFGRPPAQCSSSAEH